MSSQNLMAFTRSCCFDFDSDLGFILCTFKHNALIDLMTNCVGHQWGLMRLDRTIVGLSASQLSLVTIGNWQSASVLPVLGIIIEDALQIALRLSSAAFLSLPSPPPFPIGPSLVVTPKQFNLKSAFSYFFKDVYKFTTRKWIFFQFCCAAAGLSGPSGHVGGRATGAAIRSRLESCRVESSRVELSRVCIFDFFAWQAGCAPK